MREKEMNSVVVEIKWGDRYEHDRGRINGSLKTEKP